MNWFIETLSSTLGRKVLMALTGLFLISFLVVHVAGNMQLLANDEGRAFNLYAAFMTTNPLIKTTSYLLYGSILLHVIVSIALTRKNREARPEKYAYENASTSSSWASRNMGLLGAFLLVFIVVHMRQFWFEMHWGGIATKTYDGQEVKDLYTIVVAAFTQWWYAGFYLFAMGFLGFHLVHGFQSAFQTLGLNHNKYNSLIKFVGVAFAVIVPLLFATQPLFIFLKANGIL